jgi:hypothetical protein
MMPPLIGFNCLGAAGQACGEEADLLQGDRTGCCFLACSSVLKMSIKTATTTREYLFCVEMLFYLYSYAESQNSSISMDKRPIIVVDVFTTKH